MAFPAPIGTFETINARPMAGLSREQWPAIMPLDAALARAVPVLLALALLALTGAAT